ncbi:hypothetical protein [Collimonas silvisoli]|uniref:hypothetical protein n=1 Tax=Collimonas silvisoli TaxID=2825884 RepID=UPI001B8AAE75|nr:hypothetical protein [Collimonas silvisoli]
MSKPKIRLSITTRLDTTRWEFGKQVLEAFCETDPRLVPEYFDNVEAIKKQFNGIAACEEYWAPEVVMDAGSYGRTFTKWNSMWRRVKAVKSRGEMHHTLVNQRGQLHLGWLTFDADGDRKVDWAGLFHRLCVLAQPKFATLHLFTDIETRRGAFGTAVETDIAADDFVTGPHGMTLEKRGIPNLAWATFFGEDYAAEVDMQKLCAQGFEVEAIGQGFLVTLTPKLFDVVENFALLSARRTMLKKLFRPGLFGLAEEPAAVPPTT